MFGDEILEKKKKNGKVRPWKEKKLANLTMVLLFTPVISPEAYLEIVALVFPTFSSIVSNV